MARLSRVFAAATFRACNFFSRLSSSLAQVQSSRTALHTLFTHFLDMAASYKPVALYGLEVQANDEPVHIFEGTEFPATIRLTMAALDPTSPAEDGVDANTPVRATLKMIRIREDPEDDEFDEDDEDSDDEKLGMEDLLDDSDDDDDDDEEVNGGPSDPAKSPKARKKAALAKLRKALAEGAEDDMELDEPKADKKGKAKAAADEDEEDDDDDDEDDDEDDEDDDEDFDAEEFVLCTLDPLKVRWRSDVSGNRYS